MADTVPVSASGTATGTVAERDAVTAPTTSSPGATSSAAARAAASSDAPLAPPAERGSLDVRTKAVESLAERAALDVAGVVVRRPGFGPLRTRTSPKARVSVTDQSTRVSVEVACVWPAPVVRVAEQVRSQVAEKVAELSGLQVTSVDVEVSTVSADDATHTPRRVS